MACKTERKITSLRMANQNKYNNVNIKTYHVMKPEKYWSP